MNKKEKNIQSVFSDRFNFIVSLNHLEDIKVLQYYQLKGVSLFELRADLLDDSQFNQIKIWLDEVSNTSISILLTLRNKQQGGEFQGSENGRLKVIKELISHPAITGIDIEQNCEIAKEVIELAHSYLKITIISNHFFNQSPSLNEMNELISQFNQLSQSEFAILKLAMNLDNLDDYKKASQFLIQNSSNHKIILVGMGEFSLLSRVSFPALGSIASFCCVSNDNSATAPNQPSFKTLSKLKSICY